MLPRKKATKKRKQANLGDNDMFNIEEQSQQFNKMMNLKEDPFLITKYQDYKNATSPAKSLFKSGLEIGT